MAAGTASLGMAAGFVKDFAEHPDQWVMDPESPEGKSHHSVLKALASVGLPAGLAFAAYKIAKRDGQGMQAAIASLSGYAQGAREAAAQAYQRGLDKQATDRQARLDKGNAILAAIPAIGNLGGDVNGLFQAYGQTAGVPVPRVDTPIERTAKEAATKMYWGQVESKDPHTSAAALKSLGELLHAPALAEFGAKIESIATIGENNLIAAASALYKPLKDLPRAQQIELVNSPWFQRSLGSLIEQANKEGDPSAALKDDLLRAQITTTKSQGVAADALASLRNRTPGTGGASTLPLNQIRLLAAQTALAGSVTTIRGDGWRTQDKQVKDPTAFNNIYSATFRNLARDQGYSEDTINAILNTERSGNPGASAPDSNSTRVVFGTAAPDSNEAEEYAP